MESRTWTVQADSLEVRQLGDQTRPTIAGYAVVYNSLSVPMQDKRGREFRERIAPGAFNDHINSGTDVRALWNHNSDYPLGRTTNGTLRLAEDEHGLRVEIDPPATSWGNDAVEAIRSGVVGGMSFTFTVQDDRWTKDEGGDVRTLVKSKLHEVSPVTFPAYPATEVGVRCVSAGDTPEVPDSEQEPIVSADDGALRAQRERERRLRLLNLNMNA